MRPWRTRSRTSTLASRWVSILPPHSKVATFLPAIALGVGEHRREARRAGAFDHRLLDPDQHRDRALEVALGDQHDVVGKLLEDPRGELARLLDGNAFGQRVAAKRHVAVLDRAFHRRIELRLDPDQLDVRLHRPRRDRRRPDISPPPPIGTTIVSRSGASSSISSATVPAPAMICGSSNGVDEDIALFERQLARLGEGVVDNAAVENDLRAVAGGLGHLHRRRRLRHDDHRRNAEPLGVIGDRLRVIAGRCRDHAARPLLRRQLQQFVERAALLVGGGELQILELQPDLRADDFATMSG